jgi:two-component system sensor histidine kinase GlrK
LALSEGVRASCCIDIADAGARHCARPTARACSSPSYRGERQPEDAVRGTGIGLSIVREYVAAHGGQVALLSDGAHRFSV